MATLRALSLSRFLLNKHCIISSSRSFFSSSIAATNTTTFSLLRLRPLSAAATAFHRASPSPVGSVRAFATRQTQSSLSDSNPNWSNRPPKETILLDGCDFEHWLVVMEPPPPEMTRDDIIDMYIKTLAQIVGSEEEARMKIYSVSTRHYFAFGALVSEELSYKIKELPKVRWVLPDSYLDVKNKDYGGEPFINGQAVPYDPKYHEEWVRNNAKAMERNRRNDRPRNADRSRNYERRRQNMQNQGYQNQTMPNLGSNMGGGMPPNMGGAPNMGGPPNMGGAPPNMPPNNMGGAPPNMPPNNMGAPPNMGGGPPNMPPNNMGGPPNMGGAPPNMPPYRGGAPPMSPPNMGGAPPNMGRPPPNMGGAPNAGWSGNMPNANRGNNMPNYQNTGGMPYQNTQVPPGYQNNYGPNSNMSGPAGGNTYETRDVPGRDTP